MKRTGALVLVLAAVCAANPATLRAQGPASRPSTNPAARPIVSLTEGAAAEVKSIAADQGLKTYWLRVGVKADESSGGFRYILDITDDKPDPKSDIVRESHGVRVAVDEKSSLYLVGTVVSFRDDNRGKGFYFRNPNAK